jgi:16S rRNA (uracil1498-N3)-methyltransferase
MLATLSLSLPQSMRSVRICVDLPLAPGEQLALPAQAAEHVARVLRMAAGDAVTLFNGDGRDYRATILAAGKRGVLVSIGNARDAVSESPLALTLAQAIGRGDKMDWIVQKATELGVVRIVPLLTRRTQVQLDAARARKRVEHWRAVAIGACEQSGRALLPEVMAPLALPEWLAQLDAEPGLRLALEPGAESRLRTLHFAVPRGILVVGPEGGLGEGDLQCLREAGFSGVSLGPRILRTETAGLAALVALQALHGDG